MAKTTVASGGARRARRIARLVPAAMAATLVGATLQGPAQAGFDIVEEIECLALTIYFEARGEPDEGKIAVGHVVMNRARHPLFPGEVCNVVRQGGETPHGCQFTWWCDGRSDRPREWSAWERSKAFARRVFWQKSVDPTAGALWYHAEHVVPSWRDKLNPGPKIGRHIFYHPVDGPAARAGAEAD